MLYILTNMLMGAICSYLAGRKNRSKVWGFVWGLFGGIFAVIVYLVIKPKKVIRNNHQGRNE